MSKLAIALVGNGGFAKEVAEVIRLTGHRLAGCFADDDKPFAAPYLGRIEEMAERKAEFDVYFLAIGAVNRRTLARRKALCEQLESTGLETHALVSPHAVVSDGVEIEPGAFVAHGALVGVDAQVRGHALLNMGAIIGHDALICERAIVAPGAFIGGSACIGSDTIVGPNAKILQGISIGDDSIIGMGCNALRSLPDGSSLWPSGSANLKIEGAYKD